MAELHPEFFAERLGPAPVIAILRGHDPAAAVRAAEACWSAGIELVEVSLSHGDALAGVRAVCDRARALGRAAGAGTVLTREQLRAATDAGAAFVVSPGLDADLVRSAQALGLPSLPGVATASEVQIGLALGLRVLKAFPASGLGPGWIGAMSGPFPHVRFVAVGGVTPANAREWMEAGAVGVGVSSAIDARSAEAYVAAVR